jgi:hypothetical protein
VLDVPLADFFALKLLGKSAALDELPSLDPALASSLDFLKRYDGDVESDLWFVLKNTPMGPHPTHPPWDLPPSSPPVLPRGSLTFSVDDDEFGQRVTVDLKDGGRCVAVTAENRIEYVHLMADYRLNAQVSKQTKAVLHGMHAVVPPGWLRLFNRPELQRLISTRPQPSPSPSELQRLISTHAAHARPKARAPGGHRRTHTRRVPHSSSPNMAGARIHGHRRHTRHAMLPWLLLGCRAHGRCCGLITAAAHTDAAVVSSRPPRTRTLLWSLHGFYAHATVAHARGGFLITSQNMNMTSPHPAGGDDVPIDVSDLKRHTKYVGG